MGLSGDAELVRLYMFIGQVPRSLLKKPHATGRKREILTPPRLCSLKPRSKASQRWNLFSFVLLRRAIGYSGVFSADSYEFAENHRKKHVFPGKS